MRRPHRIARGVTVLTAVVACVQTDRAWGGLVKWEFAGEITSVIDTRGVLPGVAADTPFSGSITFDTSAPDIRPEPGFGWFENPLVDTAVDVGAVGIFGPLPQLNMIRISDGFLSGADSLDVFTAVNVGGTEMNFWLRLQDPTGTALSGDSLPAVPPDLALFEQTTLRLIRQTHDVDLGSRLTSLTPDPSTLSLMIVGAVALLRRRR